MWPGVGEPETYQPRDQAVYPGLDRNDRVYRETDVERTDLETLLGTCSTGNSTIPSSVVAFNTAESWLQDMSEDVAHELRRRCDLQLRDVPSSIPDFVERYERRGRQLTLRLA